MEWITTSTILRELRRSSDGDAWDRMLKLFRKPVVRFARQMGHSAADAEDVAQETLAAFVQAYRAGRYDRDKGRLSHWLFGFAFRQSRRAHRRNASTKTQEAGDVSGSVATEAASDIWDRAWEESLTAECLRRVRAEVEPQTFRIFELVVLEERPPAEVSRMLDLPSTVVYNCKHRVIARLRRWRARLESTK